MRSEVAWSPEAMDEARCFGDLRPAAAGSDPACRSVARHPGLGAGRAAGLRVAPGEMDESSESGSSALSKWVERSARAASRSERCVRSRPCFFREKNVPTGVVRVGSVGVGAGLCAGVGLGVGGGEAAGGADDAALATASDGAGAAGVAVGTVDVDSGAGGAAAGVAGVAVGSAGVGSGVGSAGVDGGMTGVVGVRAGLVVVAGRVTVIGAVTCTDTGAEVAAGRVTTCTPGEVVHAESRRGGDAAAVEAAVRGTSRRPPAGRDRRCDGEGRSGPDCFPVPIRRFPQPQLRWPSTRAATLLQQGAEARQPSAASQHWSGTRASPDQVNSPLLTQCG